LNHPLLRSRSIYHLRLSYFLAIIAVCLPLARAGQQSGSQTLAQVLATAGLKASPEAVSDLDQRITSYDVLDDPSVFAIAYHWELPSGMLEDPLRIVSLDRRSGKWKSKQLFLGSDEIAHSECMGAVVEMQALPDAFLIDTHINPSAGCLLVLSRDFEFRAALYGWYMAAFGDGSIVFQRSEVHFAAVHPAELAVYNPRTKKEITLFPRRPFQTIRAEYVEKLRAFYNTHQDWCRINNDPCDPETMHSDVVGDVVTSDGEHALAFVISYEPIQVFKDAQLPVGPGNVVYVCRHADDDSKLEYREMLQGDVEKRFGNVPLKALLRPETLQQIFTP